MTVVYFLSYEFCGSEKVSLSLAAIWPPLFFLFLTLKSTLLAGVILKKFLRKTDDFLKTCWIFIEFLMNFLVTNRKTFLCVMAFRSHICDVNVFSFCYRKLDKKWHSIIKKRNFNKIFPQNVKIVYTKEYKLYSKCKTSQSVCFC